MEQGDIFSYLDLCQQEKVNLQRGMNFRINPSYSILLMSLRENAPYADRIEDNGKVLIYEGHDIQKNHTELNPKYVDQPEFNPSGKRTQNGLFYEAAQKAKNEEIPELVKVYEKLRDGIWTYNGIFALVDSWKEQSNNRFVFKFKLLLIENKKPAQDYDYANLDHARMIPSHVKREVWIRDKGRCVQCGSTDNLHFDHIIPFSKGGSSLLADNVQLLCARHNLKKHNKIE